MKLKWTKCSCGYRACTLEYPTNLGQFYQGTGFRPEDKALMEEAFEALREKREKESTEALIEELNS